MGGGASPPHKLLVAGVRGCMVGEKVEEARATAARLPPVLPKRGNVGERKWYLQIWLGI